MTTPGAVIRAMQDRDWSDVRRIYRLGMETGHATFETEVPPAATLAAKWIAGQRWVATVDDAVAGWAAMSAVSTRDCYRGVAETSVYVDPRWAGHGLGRALVEHQVAAAIGSGFWTLQATIFAENEASLALHRAAGFREVGRRERIARRDGVWHDTVLLEFRAAD